MDPSKIYDVVIIGAGISGISSASHLQTYSPEAEYIVIENRKDIGGNGIFLNILGLDLTLICILWD